MANSEYTRAKLAALAPTDDHSLRYWRAAAKQILDRYAALELVEVVKSGNKMDSQYLQRGGKHSPKGIAVVIASTGGKWGKSRRNYYPAA